MSGAVLVDDVPVEKAGVRVSSEAAVRIRGVASVYVGRGGDKIEAAFEHFGIELEGVVALDVGASTGGFTDCMLRRGAKRVYAVDVGVNQLDYSLRTDERVVVMEKTHAVDLAVQHFSPRPTVGVMDLSFISLRKVLQPIVAVLKKPFALLVLVKPQFELEPEYVSKGGVVREKEYQERAVTLVEDCGRAIGLVVRGSLPSPLKGGKKGNQEYFVYFVSDSS